MAGLRVCAAGHREKEQCLNNLRRDSVSLDVPSRQSFRRLALVACPSAGCARDDSGDHKSDEEENIIVDRTLSRFQDAGYTDDGGNEVISQRRPFENRGASIHWMFLEGGVIVNGHLSLQSLAYY